MVVFTFNRECIKTSTLLLTNNNETKPTFTEITNNSVIHPVTQQAQVQDKTSALGVKKALSEFCGFAQPGPHRYSVSPLLLKNTLVSIFYFIWFWSYQIYPIINMKETY